MSNNALKVSKVAVVRVSPKGGHFSKVYVQEQTHMGWLRGTSTPEVSIHGGWYAPQNVLMVSDVHTTYDYGAIPAGTLVQYWTGFGPAVGIITNRMGARYEITNAEKGTVIVDWSGVHPVEAEEKTC